MVSEERLVEVMIAEEVCRLLAPEAKDKLKLLEDEKMRLMKELPFT